MLKQVAMCLVMLAAGCSGGSDVTALAPAAMALPSPILLHSDNGTICNAVRINAGTVATAAHCLHGGAAFRLVEDGYDLPVTVAGVHPGYAFATARSAAGFDLAKLTAAAPLGQEGNVAIHPITPGPAEIWALTETGALRVQPCQYLGRSGTLVELACPVALGWSGAPVVQNGALVGILSARGQADLVDIVQMADATLLQSF